QLGGIPLEIGHFLVGQELPAFELLRALERRRGVVRPHAGDVRMTVRAARRRPCLGRWFGSRLLRLRTDWGDAPRKASSNDERSENLQPAMIHGALRLS